MTPTPEAVKAALDKVAAACQVASARQDALKTAIDNRKRSGTFLVDSRRCHYHDALVELHQATWEWMFLTQDPKATRRP